MNKIIVNRNRIQDYKDEKIEIKNNRIYFKCSDEYILEYNECNEIELEFNIDNCFVKIEEFCFDSELNIKKTYNINHGYLKIDKFYNNKMVDEKIDFNLLQDSDRIDYNFANICLGEEKYLINVNHHNKKTVSEINNRTVTLKNGKIDYVINSRVSLEGIKSKLDQNTRVVTLDESEAKICPNMYIDLDDVEAKHGSVIGTFKDDQLFYLMSKGISYPDALKLLIKGYLLNKLEINIDMRRKIIDIIDKYWR